MAEENIPNIPKDIFDDMYKHAEETYPGECCGFLLGEKGRNEINAIRRLKNVYDEYHVREPESYPRTSKTAYLIEPIEILKIQKESRSLNSELKVIYHSHVDVGAYFSEEDKRVATIEGEPLFPGVFYIVISARNSRSDGAALFVWDESKRDFILCKSLN